MPRRPTKYIPMPAFTDKAYNRFMSKVNKNTITGCWDWLSGKNKAGYGTFKLAFLDYLAHRVSLRFIGFDLKNNLVINHICRNHACVNPSHLEQVTSRYNIIVGVNPVAINANKTHCIYGHEFTKENTYMEFGKYGTGRKCRICKARINKNIGLRKKIKVFA